MKFILFIVTFEEVTSKKRTFRGGGRGKYINK